MKAIPVEPIEVRRVTGFMSGPQGCGVGSWDQPIYPPSPRSGELRHARVHEGPYLNLRQAAKLLGIGVVELSGLETGSHTFATDAEWQEAIALMRAPAPDGDGGAGK